MIGREFRTVGDLPNANVLETNTSWVGTGRMQGYVRGH
jgi:hypothetical protein